MENFNLDEMINYESDLRNRGVFGKLRFYAYDRMRQSIRHIFW